MGDLLHEETVSLQDCFNCPIASRPVAVIEVLERVSYDGNKTMSLLGMTMTTAMTIETFRVETCNPSQWEDTTIDALTVEPYESLPYELIRTCLNLGSYNYLGFADDWDITCKSAVLSALNALPTCSLLLSARIQIVVFDITKP